MEVPEIKETKAQRVEWLKREKNAWECLDEIQRFTRYGYGATPPEWLGTYFRSWGVYTQGDGVSAVGGQGGEGKADTKSASSGAGAGALPRSSRHRPRRRRLDAHRAPEVGFSARVGATVHLLPQGRTAARFQGVPGRRVGFRLDPAVRVEPPRSRVRRRGVKA